jgi:hypothetical protein
MLACPSINDDRDVDAVGEQPARAFVSQVVPPQVDPQQLFAIPLGSATTRLGSPPWARRRTVSHAVWIFGCTAPASVPKTYASGPRAARRARIAASRPFGLNGMRRFSLSFAVAPGMPIWQVSQFTRVFWINSIRLGGSTAPAHRDAIVEKR